MLSAVAGFFVIDRENALAQLFSPKTFANGGEMRETRK